MEQIRAFASHNLEFAVFLAFVASYSSVRKYREGWSTYPESIGMLIPHMLKKEALCEDSRPEQLHSQQPQVQKLQH